MLERVRLLAGKDAAHVGVVISDQCDLTRAAELPTLDLSMQTTIEAHVYTHGSMQLGVLTRCMCRELAADSLLTALLTCSFL